jgi:hypothetical protein
MYVILMKWRFVVCVVVGLVLGLFFVRALGSQHIDDVNPLMNCSEEYLLKADVLYVVPYFDGVMINESREWCDYILSLGKDVGMHGIRHTYGEFSREVSLEDIELGMEIFRNCFGFWPSRFKAPQLGLNSANKKLIEGFGMEIDGKPSQVIHKAYHCNDGGIIPNSLHSLF